MRVGCKFSRLRAPRRRPREPVVKLHIKIWIKAGYNEDRIRMGSLATTTTFTAVGRFGGDEKLRRSLTPSFPSSYTNFNNNNARRNLSTAPSRG